MTDINEVIEHFYNWVLTDPIKTGLIEKYNCSMYSYCSNKATMYSKDVDNYLLISDYVVYDVFDNEIVIDGGDVDIVKLHDIDFSCTESAAFQLSTLYDFRCSTESIVLLLKIVLILRKKTESRKQRNFL
ncbi:hypothetical protein [Klebsiella phage phiKp_21]|nr:hypothetical protein [Klebsiella phage phiKp_21]